MLEEAGNLIACPAKSIDPTTIWERQVFRRVRQELLMISLKVFQMGALAFGLCVVAGTACADTTNTRDLKVDQLGPGVYTIRHPDPTDDFPDGNTTVVIGEREVLVIDTCYLPSSADGDIARIRQWTNKPVRWVLNTHWHNDHIGGNHRYRLAWPGVQIVGHDETRRMIDARVRSYVRRFAAADSAFGKQREALRKTVEQGVDAKGAAVNAAGRKAAAESLKKLESAAAQFRDITLDPPNVTFANELRIDLGGRVVELKHLGRGNTGGDVVAWQGSRARFRRYRTVTRRNPLS